MLILALALALAPDDTAEQYYKFPKDTVWKYSMTNLEEKKEEMVMTVTGSEKDKVTAEVVTKGEHGHATKLLLNVRDDIFFWAEQRGDELADSLALYKLGSKKGDTWTLAGKKGMLEQTATHMGTEEIKVPAGTYKDAVHVRIELTVQQDKFRIDAYLAEKVGLVKMTYTVKDKERSMILEEFKPAK